MSNASPVDHQFENQMALKQDGYVTAKDIRIAFFEFKEEINPKFSEIEKSIKEEINPKFLKIEKSINEIEKSINTLKTQMICGIAALSLIIAGMGFMFKILFEISSRLPK